MLACEVQDVLFQLLSLAVIEQDSFMMKIEGNIDGYSDIELAKKFKQLQPASQRQSAQIKQDFESLMSDGYVIIKGLLTPSQCHDIKTTCLPLMARKGRNEFEGVNTQRLYNVLAKTRCIDRLADHPRILGLMDLIFRPNFLLSQSQVINILPGEKQQAYHYDDSFYQIPRPRPPLGAASIWAIDDFTQENGATLLCQQVIIGMGSNDPLPAMLSKQSCQRALYYFSLEPLGTGVGQMTLNFQDLLLPTSTVKHLCGNKRITY